MKERGLLPPAGERGLLARLLPELGEAELPTHEDDRVRLVHAVSTVLDDALVQGLRIVLVDDLQFADDASVELLRSLVAGVPCSWVLAMRPHELQAPARDLVEALERRSTSPAPAVRRKPSRCSSAPAATPCTCWRHSRQRSWPAPAATRWCRPAAGPGRSRGRAHPT
jgi:hypothetical protein